MKEREKGLGIRDPERLRKKKKSERKFKKREKGGESQARKP